MAQVGEKERGVAGASGAVHHHMHYYYRSRREQGHTDKDCDGPLQLQVVVVAEH